MENQQLSVSVVIPVYNGEKFLESAIHHVKNQNYHPVEIIVIDDGSTDETAEVAAKFKDSIRYVYQENSGPAAARNHGIKIAKGDAIAFLDVDDLWSEDKLKLQANYLAANRGIEIVQGLIQQMKLSQHITDGEATFEAAYKPYNYINLGSALYRKSVFERVGFFDETLRFGEDVDWFIRAWENRIEKAVLEQVTLFYRLHRNNMTLGKNSVELGFLKIYKKYLDRCRNRGTLPSSSLPGMPQMNEYLGAPPNTQKIF